jgi:hypothetical protein
LSQNDSHEITILPGLSRVDAVSGGLNSIVLTFKCLQIEFVTTFGFYGNRALMAEKIMNPPLPAPPLIENPEGGSIYQPGVVPKAFGATLGISPQTLRPGCPAPAGRRESFQDERSSLWAKLIHPSFFILTKFK